MRPDLTELLLRKFTQWMFELRAFMRKKAINHACFRGTIIAIETAGVMQELTRILLITAGTISVGLGIVGMFVPLLPTTPFLLLGAVCYGKSSDHLYRRLIENRVCGSYITNYRERGGITRRQKVTVLAVLWLSMANTAWFLAPVIWVKILLLLVASAVTFYLVRLKTVGPDAENC